MKFIQGESKSQTKSTTIPKTIPKGIKFLPDTIDKLSNTKEGVYIALSDGGYGRIFKLGGKRVFETITKEEYAAQ